ncbi:terminase, large subunit, PBSX family [Streptomyces turgidiscabies Car8]|uniref:Terminase, large subunit, PBSX family n=1 Tax=Streptomyces turgidiscabies (strain Car8) TaxID=698760 RepID=L7F8V4_STRT8|nr:LAGLIDADG family homing endonuclease [Streptomyces turgidiscabies]ELP67637.1 terminase, large subunit, PBSX family [Streptomyces turgidiscabies Car8]
MTATVDWAEFAAQAFEPRNVFGLLDYVPTPKQCEFHAATEFDVLYGGAAGGGKGGRCPDRAAPSYNSEVETKVLTPKGFKLIGDIRTGDAVCNPDGTTAKVIGIFDNGPKQFYRITLADGSTVEADEDHLWAISIAGTRKRRKEAAPVIPAGLRPEDEWNLRVQSRCRIVNTMELRELVLRAADEKARGLRPRYVQLPLTNPVNLTAAKGRWPVFSPYVLGALIGDGSTQNRSVAITGIDAEVFERIADELPDHLQLVAGSQKSGRCPSYAITRRNGEGDSATTLIKRDGLDKLHSWEKFVPRRIKLAPAADRFAFIQGLMDTDGHMDARGHVEFVTVSEQLAKDAQEVLRSLGYRATLTTKTPTYTHNGEKRDGRLAYRLYVQGRHMDRLFHMPRKRERVSQFNGGDVEPWHRIVSVEPTGIDNSRCIQVDNLNHLYVTDDYIVTHNTRALLMDAIRDCDTHPGLRVGAFRRSYPELKESLIAELAQMEYAKAIGARWNGTEYELRFPNGSLIMFRYAETVQDATRRQGGQYQKLLFDERTLTPPDVVSFLESRLRSGRRDIPVLGIRSGTNPGGAGHGAVKTRYIKPTNYGEKVITDARNRTVRFIPSKLSDNPHVNPEYAQDLQALDGKLRSAFLDGDWDVFQGQMFPELKRDRHVVEPITLPASWRRYNGLDWGFTAPWAVLWAAVDEDGRVWVYREIYRRGVGEADQAKQILEAEAAGEHIAVRFADDAMWATRGDAKAIADVYSENGVHLTQAGKGAGSRVTGWQRVRSYLKEGPACPQHRAQGWNSCPMLHLFSTVTELYRELSDLPHATKGNPEDADTTADDHASDAVRYLLTNLGTGPEMVILDAPPAEPAVELLQPLGPTMAYRPAEPALADDAWWYEDDETPRAGRTVQAP